MSDSEEAHKSSNGGVKSERNGHVENGFDRIRASLKRKKNGDQMPIKEFEFWHEALERDAVELIQSVLDEYSASSTERLTLVNGRFVYDCQPHHARSHKDIVQLPCAYERPLVLAAVFQSTGTINLFLENSADLFVQDIGSDTVIHGIIKAAAIEPEHQDNYVQIYEFLINRLTDREKRRLLFLEDADGLRPLELSARLRTFKLFQKIFGTEGVYLFKKGIIGAHLCTWYDVTDYESVDDNGKRRKKSPLRMFTVMEKEFLLQARQSAFVDHPALQKWISGKIWINVPYLVFWFFLRLFYTGLIFVCAVSDVSLDQALSPENRTGWPDPNSEYCPQAIFTMNGQMLELLIVSVICFSFLIVIFDIAEFIAYHSVTKQRDRRCYHAFASRNFVVRTRFYRICNFLLAASVIIFHASKKLDPESTSQVTPKAYMLANILNIWSLLFFIQLLPALGYFVTIIQRMLKDMFHFLILYVILFFSFSQTFFNLFYINHVCSKEFKDMFWSMYSTFRVMLNMIELTEEYPGSYDLAILHTTYVIVVPILLVNFLIALMSNSVSDVAENRQLIMLLQRLSAAILVEERLEKIIVWFYKKKQHNYYVVKDGRIYVECFVLKQKDIK